MSKVKSYTNTMMSLMSQLKSGDSFLTDISPQVVTAYARAHKTKVTTEQCVLINDYKKENPALSKVTKVTIL
jgi:hypothetical protein